MPEHEDGLYGAVKIGQPVFDEAGEEIGSVRGIDRAGFYVLGHDREEDVGPITDIRDVTGTAYVIWRCWECGEMGKIEGELPGACPSCDSPREDLYYWAED